MSATSPAMISAGMQSAPVESHTASDCILKACRSPIMWSCSEGVFVPMPKFPPFILMIRSIGKSSLISPGVPLSEITGKTFSQRLDTVPREKLT